MNERFLKVVEEFDKKLGSLLSQAPLKFGQLPSDMPKSGVYIFSENGSNLYVGRSNSLRNRYFLHCRPGSRQNQASFAFKLARKSLQLGPPNYSSESSREALIKLPEFKEKFDEAKKRIREMDYRYLEEPNQKKQFIFEAYCAIVLDTPYYDFGTY